MALTNEQRQQLLDLKARGVSKERAMAQVFRRPETEPRETRFGDVGEDIMSAGRGVVSDIQGRGENIVEGFRAGARGEQTPIETGAQMAGNILGGAGDIAFRGAQAAITPFMKESEERAVEGAVTEAVAPIGEAIAETSPRTQRNIMGGLGLFEGATAGVGAAATKPVTQGITSRIGRFFGRGADEAAQAAPVRQTPEQIFAKTETRLQQISNDPNLSAQEKAAAAQSALTFRERLAGVTPSEKKRIQEMPPGTLERYLDQAHLRNINDTEMTPYTMGAQQANDALENLEKQLRESGSQIGQTRQKLSTVQMPRTAVERVDKAFKDELNRLNLTVRNDEIVTQPGKIAKTSSASDINTLQDLYGDMKVYKQSPTLANAIDLRMKFDGKIKFGKSAREVSNDVDPVSRSVRRALADEAAKTVGRSNADELARYSDFMEAYADLKSYTDRAAGGEYLLRLVLSGRGGEAQKLVDTVREYTGKDLMNDATAMKIATDVVGDTDQKNLFRQEVTSAGLDAARLFSGDVSGVGATIAKKLAERGIDQEAVYRAIAAGAGVYLLTTYTDDEGMLLPAGMVVLAAMPPEARMEAVQKAREMGKRTNVPDDIKDNISKALDEYDADAIKLRQNGRETIELGNNTDSDLFMLKQKHEQGALTNDEYIQAYDALLQKGVDPIEDMGKAQSATTKTTDLVEEAKKYDSAARFVDEVFAASKGNMYENVPPNLIEQTQIDEFGTSIKIRQTTDSATVLNWKKRIDAGERPIIKIDDLIKTPDVGDGHHRLEAYKQLGFSEVPTIRKSQLEDIWKQANETTDLVEEAKKYDSAEEFKQSLGKPYYHGAREEWSGQFNQPREGEYLTEAIFVAPSETSAAYYDRGGGVKKVFIDPDARLWDYKTDTTVLDGLRKDKRFTDYVEKNWNYTIDEAIEKVSSGEYDWVQRPEVLAYLRKNGYDGFVNIDHGGGETIGIFSNKKVVTEEQIDKQFE